ncbi:hypothetical protein BDQ17DRAFT_1426899 [Cyathus striatus]|nr:hypothetical protein BDQ17DRAFT_1426899 [Cyathus striatus]
MAKRDRRWPWALCINVHDIYAYYHFVASSSYSAFAVHIECDGSRHRPMSGMSHFRLVLRSLMLKRAVPSDGCAESTGSVCTLRELKEWIWEVKLQEVRYQSLKFSASHLRDAIPPRFPHAQRLVSLTAFNISNYLSMFSITPRLQSLMVENKLPSAIIPCPVSTSINNDIIIPPPIKLLRSARTTRSTPAPCADTTPL